MIDLEVYWEDEYGDVYRSKVYCIDSVRDRFLVTNRVGYFRFVPISSCETVEKEVDE